ncbi:MAG: flagellar filament capping protein FliD [Planctomycetota bacterium]|jgi:flagellar capping protein FliD
MGELRFPGLVTGIDTAALIKQLMIINSRRLATYQVQKTEYEAQNTALDGLRTKISALESAASALSDADDLDIMNATTSNSSVLSLSASSDAAEGSHSILINQLATTETWIQDTSSFDYETDYVGAGTFIYSYNYQQIEIPTVADETTLEDLVGLINEDEENPGVSASLLYQGDKYHLMLSGQETGIDYQISIDSTYTEVWEAGSALTKDESNAGLTTKIIDIDDFTGEAADLAGDEKITISGTVHGGAPITSLDIDVKDDTTIEHLIAKINEAFTGVAKATFKDGKIVLTDLVSDTSSLSIGLSYDAGTGSTSWTMPTMAVSTEGGGSPTTPISPSSFTQTQNAQNAEIKVDDFTMTPVAELQTLTPTVAPTSGTYRLTFEGQTTAAIQHDASHADIKLALEALSNVVFDDITVGGDNAVTGLAGGDLTFTFLSTAGDVGMISIDSSSLVPSASSNYSVVETIEGVYNEWISRNSNTISNALTGLTLNLNDVNELDLAEDPIPVKITVSRNTGAVSKKINSMVTAYNALITELKSKTEYNAETKKMGILSKDIAVSFIKAQSRDPFIGIVEGFVDTIDDFVQASDIGITFDGTGMMEFDTDEFNDAINDNFDHVLELLGATKSGNSSDSSIVDFYAASDKFTTAGTYDVEVVVDSDPKITSVKIKLSSESTWRDLAWPDNFVTCNNDFDDYGDPLYPENGLQFTIDSDLSEGTYTVTINVKQGIAGALEDLLNGVLEADGRLDVSGDILDDRITAMARRIENEENRLTDVETRLIAKYARLEKTLAMMQEQMAAVSMVSAATFGS